MHQKGDHSQRSEPLSSVCSTCSFCLVAGYVSRQSLEFDQKMQQNVNPTQTALVAEILTHMSIAKSLTRRRILVVVEIRRLIVDNGVVAATVPAVESRGLSVAVTV